ncbi:MAG TPA: nicotinate (nicotinamide) nucleotide adenylyltransferase [Methylibium sp.]|uniref:nicotinate (nicotinamide) nucleotide adenylyltransferase n=1 Tax=Methylibium sp. TaxID=2067992 RepID=UPI002DB6FF1B|nr:nicotinate (nicotinamide) nucleotide adenylyltransferase [Methylibium sp.]HEU4458425.1 nicotinate (nicotinamide) nucleotide adenylyltransferase [Methylibium sp.]
MKIGLFGGSFDPPHQGHRALAESALDHLGLDELRWLPAGRPWQRQHRLAAAEDRRAMVATAIADRAAFVLDDRELHRPGASYTIDTACELLAERPGAQLFLLIGEDQLQRLPTWHRWRALIERVTLAVAYRGAMREPPAELLAALQPEGRTIERLPMPPFDVSSTEIRARLAAAHSAQALAPHLLAPQVARYIDLHRLYATHP